MRCLKVKRAIQQQIDQVVIPNSTIAIHTISGENAVEDATSILWNGMRQSHRTEGGLPGNFIIVNNTADIEPNIYSNDINHNNIVVVVSIPEVMQDKNGDLWYIGKYPAGCQKYDNDANDLPMNHLIEKTKKIPREFIAGLYITNEGQSVLHSQGVNLKTMPVEKFVPNSSFIGNLTPSEQADFFETIKGPLVEEGLKKVHATGDLHNALNSFMVIYIL